VWRAPLTSRARARPPAHRFCGAELGDWRPRLTPEELRPQLEHVQPTLAICYEGKVSVARARAVAAVPPQGAAPRAGRLHGATRVSTPDPACGPGLLQVHRIAMKSGPDGYRELNQRIRCVWGDGGGPLACGLLCCPPPPPPPRGLPPGSWTLGGGTRATRIHGAARLSLAGSCSS
jgi:hypothetical protein